MVLLAWVYYAAQIFLLGAEFTKVYADEHGSNAAARASAATQATADAGTPQQSDGHEGAGPAALPAGAAAAVQLQTPEEAMGRQGRAAAMRVVYELVAIAGLQLAARLLSRRRKAEFEKVRRLSR